MDRPEMSAMTTMLAVENTRLREENAELREALRPFANYAEKRAAMPLRGLSNVIHTIHAGHQHEASILLTDCQLARALLAKGA